MHRVGDRSGGQGPRADPPTAGEFAQETHGNPFLLIELVGCFDPDTDSFEPLPLHEVLTRNWDGCRSRRGIIPGCGRSLGASALAGGGLTDGGGMSLPPIATIIRIRNERLVRLVGPEESPLIDTYHDRVRETRRPDG